MDNELFEKVKMKIDKLKKIIDRLDEIKINILVQEFNNKLYNNEYILNIGGCGK